MQSILLLHGAIGAMDQLADLENNLADSFLVHRLNFSGHGRSPFADQPFSIHFFAEEVINFLDKNEIEKINLFGYSMGGYVAMYLADHHPHRINKLITLATKFKWDETIAAKEIKMLQADKIEDLLPAFAISLQKRHAPNNWKTVLEKTAAMLFEMGNDNPLKPGDYNSIHHPALLMLGDRDKMVTLDETLEVYKSLPNAQLAVLPNTSHPIELLNTDRLVYELKAFLMKDL
jgi:pimeloyl-ACP methyl ester carboxylesterase